ncbi:nuclear receptor-binding protein-like protein [Lates japonicus]|uniref:Nuclear receptor-binding protein-like protein n=1 Tax=Lates japonicus TaxID=270547 RepID=A0AAD3M8M8_LATJO|nr:nuclear receptor-binding protein-like protein [Lates japonicus]
MSQQRQSYYDLRRKPRRLRQAELNSQLKIGSAWWEAVKLGVASSHFSVFNTRLLGLTKERMSEGENKQAPDTVQEAKPESMAAAPTGQGVSSVSPPVSMVTQSPATAATEDEEE